MFTKFQLSYCMSQLVTLLSLNWKVIKSSIIKKESVAGLNVVMEA
jgi:hypothetical protein